jgi:hypothetical protein
VAAAATQAASAPAIIMSTAPDGIDAAAASDAVATLCSDSLEGHAACVRVQPRGLLNTGNSCFVNSVVQALLASKTFCGFLAVLRRCARLIDPEAAPTLYALAALAAEFQPHGAASNEQEQEEDKEEDDDAGWAEVARGGKKGKAAASAGSSSPAPTPPASAAAALGAMVVLGAKPLVPAMLNPVVHRFSPKQAAVQSNGRVSMAQVGRWAAWLCALQATSCACVRAVTCAVGPCVWLSGCCGCSFQSYGQCFRDACRCDQWWQQPGACILAVPTALLPLPPAPCA